MPNKSIGQFIAALRKANGLTQKELAEKLNVSDKAISRWERDECAPDITLIPVIAEIFSVTCDELLCGEKKSADNIFSQNDSENLSPKAEKQQRRILNSNLSELKNRSYIVLVVSFIGLITAAICNLGFNRAYIGFFAAVIFFAVSVVCQLIFSNKAFFSVSDVNIGEEEIGEFKLSATKITSRMISLILALTAFCLPLVILVDDAYMGLTTKSWVLYGAICLVPVLIICLIVCNVIVMNSAKKSKLMISYEKNKQKFVLKAVTLVSLAVVMLITFGIYNLITGGGNPAALVDGTKLDKDSFVALMEREVHEDNNFGMDYVAVDSEEFEEDEVINEEDLYEYIVDDDGNVVCKFIYRNESVTMYEYEFDSDGELRVRVLTINDWEQGKDILEAIQVAFAIAYTVEAVGALIFYLAKRKKFK